MADNEVSLYLQGGQGQVGGPLVPLLGHGNKKENPNWASIRAAENVGLSTSAPLARVNNRSGYPNQHIKSLLSDQLGLFSINFAGNVKNHKI